MACAFWNKVLCSTDIYLHFNVEIAKMGVNICLMVHNVSVVKDNNGLVDNIFKSKFSKFTFFLIIVQLTPIG